MLDIEEFRCIEGFEMYQVSKLTESDVLEIRERLFDGETQQSIADSFGIDRSTISCIKTGRLWGHVC